MSNVITLVDHRPRDCNDEFKVATKSLRSFAQTADMTAAENQTLVTCLASVTFHMPRKRYTAEYWAGLLAALRNPA